MVEVLEFAPGGYRFIKAVFQYSGGVAAMPGYRIVRVRFTRLLPMVEGFQRIETILKAAGRPLTAFCACELRSPAPFTESDFRALNEAYAAVLQRWSIYDGKTNPIARSNVCPAFNPPTEPSFYAFAYTEVTSTREPSFVVSGSAEAPEGRGDYRSHIVRLGDTSVDGLRNKVRYVLEAMETRLSALHFQWQDTTATHVYTVHDFHPMFAEEIVPRRAAHGGVTWYYCRPPVIDLEYEMDCRAVSVEHMVAV